jgi:hypothetical protein
MLRSNHLELPSLKTTEPTPHATDAVIIWTFLKGRFTANTL